MTTPRPPDPPLEALAARSVPFMVDATVQPIDFTVLDPAHVEACATRVRCGVCGGRIKRGPIAFVGPDDGRRCFADPWLHPACAERAMRRCPFLAGRRDWREDEARSEPLLSPYSAGMAVVLARSWRSHRDPAGAWHFEAVGPLSRPAGAGGSEPT
jgi:hypothetical protein